jgi:hypothetical protein
MSWSEYFETKRGIGVLSTADAEGKVNAALYGRPRVVDDRTVAFLMSDRRTRRNLQANARASFLFKEEGGFEGTRLYLTKIAEERDAEKVAELRASRGNPGRGYTNDDKWIVTFRIDEVRPLSGAVE